MSGGIILLNKPKGKSSFYLVSVVRAITGLRKVGHAGTLDPMATGLMIMLAGSDYTKSADQFIGFDKRYLANCLLGKATSTEDVTGEEIASSDKIPSLTEIEEAIAFFQGDSLQTPPMFSAKKQAGVPLYKLARQGKEIFRPACNVWMNIRLIDYTYPYLKLEVHCSKGCYIRSLARDIGEKLGCFATLAELERTQIGPFTLDHALTLENVGQLRDKEFFDKHVLTSIPGLSHV